LQQYIDKPIAGNDFLGKRHVFVGKRAGGRQEYRKYRSTGVQEYRSVGVMG
jgi:hypothetical protein